MTHGDETGWREQPAPTRVARRTQYADLFVRVWRLGEQHALTDEHPCCVLAKRRLRHQDELFQFVVVPGLPADNNLAERSIRPLVIMRKISGGTRSAEGTETRLTLASLLRTGAARNLNPFLECYAPPPATDRHRSPTNFLTRTANTYKCQSF